MGRGSRLYGLTVTGKDEDGGEPCPTAGSKVETEADCRDASKWFTTPKRPFSNAVKCDDPDNCHCFVGNGVNTVGHMFFAKTEPSEAFTLDFYFTVCRLC